MEKRYKATPWISVAVLFLILTMLGNGSARQSPDMLVRATALLNRSVHFSEKDRTGEIREVYVDPVSGLIPFCILSFNAFLGTVEKNVLVSIPWTYVNFKSRNQQFVIREIKSEGDDEISPLEYKSRKHQQVSPAEAENIYRHYDLENLLERSRRETDSDSNIPVIDILRLENIPVYSQGTRFGRAASYFMSLDSGMIRTILLEQSGTDTYVMIPFPILRFDPVRFAYILKVPEERIAQAPQVEQDTFLYYEHQDMQKLYAAFGLSDLLEQ
ncbi:MAG: hypothetical protein ACOC0U_00580 [Desulfovibrionales bacterium]